jgi:polyisoprenoid-binding protein YceI
VTIDAASVLTGVPDLDKHVKSADFLDVEKFPTATYKGKFAQFKDGAPTQVQGDLTLHGVTKPVALTIKSLKCKAHPMKPGVELCGADAHGEFDREAFGIAWGKNFGFAMKVGLNIQVEATAASK